MGDWSTDEIAATGLHNSELGWLLQQRLLGDMPQYLLTN